MKSITKFLFSFCFIMLILTGSSLSQNKFSIGGYIGGGSISGFSVATGSFTSTLFVELNPGFMNDVNTRLSFFFAQDFDILFGQQRDYFPFLKGVSLKGIITQDMSDKFYLEEGIGLIIINDRTYIDVNEWDYGIVFSLLAGIDLRKITNNGFRIGAGVEYGMTFANTFAKYFSLHFQTQYIF